MTETGQTRKPSTVFLRSQNPRPSQCAFLGYAIGRLPLINDDLAAGRLAVVVDHVVPVSTGYWLVAPPGTETRREIIAFRNWLVEGTSKLNWPPHSAKAQPCSGDTLAPADDGN